MTFLNAALLAGVLAFNVPLIIHLLNKSRYKRVDWGAMFLLEQVVRQNRKRVRLEQIIMLLVRCSIPVLLALAMAQPILSGWQKLVGSAPGSTVVMLDASYSMQARDPGADGRSRFDEARDRTRGVLETMPQGSRGTVIRVGGGFDPVTQTLTPELDRVGNRLDGLDADLGVADGPEALRRGVEALNEANTLKRDLVLVSDFQRVSWARDSGVQRQRLTDLVNDAKVKPSVVLMPVGDRPGRNLAVMDAHLTSQAVGVGQRVRIVATVLNTSDQPAPDTPVTLSVDGAAQETQRLSIDAGQSADVVFFHAFDAGGPHTLEVAVSDGVLPADDVVYVAVNVLQSLPVLLVSEDADPGRPRPPFPEGETDFLEVALQPFAASADAPLADLIRPSVIGPQMLTAEALAGQRVVVLANVPAVSDQQAQALRGFVEHGGALVIFPGDLVDVQQFNRVLYNNGKGLSPASITGLTGKGLGFDEGATLLDQRHEDPALSLWNDPANGSLSDARFDIWYELEPIRDAQVAARLSTGHACLVQHEVGEGVVIVGASSIDAGWGNLPTRPMYLPLMQRLIAFAATHAEPPSNVEPGRPLVALLDTVNADDDDRNARQATEADWFTPAGDRVTRPIESVGGRRVCTLDSAALPGYYRLIIDGKPQRVFAVNTPRDESDLDRLTDAEIDEMAAAIGATVVRDADAHAQIDRDRRHGRPVWRVLWALALALVFGELLLQQWFGKGGRA